MKYKLNDDVITKATVDELVNDLSQFPYDAADYSLSIKDRKSKYSKSLKNEKKLQIADDLYITVTE